MACVYILSSTLYALCIEAKINFANQNEGKITLKSLGQNGFGSFQLNTVAKKNLESRNQSILSWLTRYHEKFLNMLSTKYEGLSYPTHFLKSMGSVIRNTFLKY